MDDDSTGSIAVSIAEPAWLAERGDLETLCRMAAEAVLARHAPDMLGQAELGIRLTGDAEIRELNRLYRHKDHATNVLSFPADSGIPAQPGAPLLLGDLVVAHGVVAFEAAAEGKRLADHLAHLVVHGTLHLLGFDHEDDAEAARMEEEERRILARLGVADPYLNEVPQ